MRPEFDVTLAYNPESVLIPVARVEGIGWTLLGAGTGDRRLDRRRPGRRGAPGWQPRSGRAARAVRARSAATRSGLTGNSRAAQWMILDQLVDEARGRIVAGLASSRC